MARRARIPAELVGDPFRGSDAVRRWLLTRDQLRGAAWARVLRDVYVTAEHRLDPTVRLSAARLVAPAGAVLAGRTAAWLHGVWTPPPGHPVPLETALGVRGPNSRREGIARRRLVLRGSADLVRPLTGISQLDHDVVEAGGPLLTSAMRTCFDLMRERALVEAVVVADAFAAGGLWLPLLDAYCADRRRWPGIRRAREAVELATKNARSPGESRLRMVVVLAGLPRPLVNVPVLAGAGETVLGIPDLLVPGRRLIAVEYDGAYHDAGEQPAVDRRRSNRLTVGSLPVLHYNRESVLHERHVVAEQIARACGERDPVPLDDRDFRRPPPHRAW